MSTIGVDFKAKDMQIGDRKVRVQIWDTAGQERFRNITGGYYRKAHGVAIVFDVTSQSSFTTISNWVKEISKSAPENTVKVLIANKTDMTSLRLIPENEARALSQEFNLYYFETSAKDDVGVNEVFDFMANRIYSNIEISPNFLEITSESLRKQVNEGPGRTRRDPITTGKCCR
jgi:small GTP-binding protein